MIEFILGVVVLVFFVVLTVVVTIASAFPTIYIQKSQAGSRSNFDFVTEAKHKLEARKIIIIVDVDGSENKIKLKNFIRKKVNKKKWSEK